MSDIIRLLPDSVANQIAAGEVIQRPASAVKEMLENSVDAGASVIKLIIKDSGRTLIQVTDNGHGMSPIDARMCFERHATSKLKDAHDLLAIRTLGFRGEALASIASVAQVELKTRTESEEVGTSILVEGSQVKNQEVVSCAVGSSFSVKNLFFNVPARRNFLKSDSAEFRHILEEFQRVALVHSEIEFSLFHNDKLVLQLNKGNLRQRIVQIFGNTINERLLPVELSTEHVTINGFIGKPEAARRMRGEQFFFANGRYIRYPYLSHAIEDAFNQLIPDSFFPSYFIFIQVDPATIDVNIHPTKTEVNFQYSQLVYTSLLTAVRHSLGLFTLSPTFDFDRDPTFDIQPPPGYEPKQPVIKTDPGYNPFKGNQQTSPYRTPGSLNPNRADWEKLYEINRQPDSSLFGHQDQPVNKESTNVSPVIELTATDSIKEEKLSKKLFQLNHRYILANIKSGLVIVDIHKARERILFEQIFTIFEEKTSYSQRLLFPISLHLPPSENQVFMEIIDSIRALGFELSELGNGSYVINGTPAALPVTETGEFIEHVIESYKEDKNLYGGEKNNNLARAMARTIAVGKSKILSTEDMESLIDQLFACRTPSTAPDGGKTLKIITFEEIERLFS